MNESVVTIRRTRAERWCDWCHKRIAPGDRYKRVVVFGNPYEGYVKTFWFPEHVDCRA